MASKKLERIHLESFLKSVGWDYSSIEEREHPDFIVKTGSDLFGVEVTQIFKDLKDNDSRIGSITKMAESKRENFIAELAKEYYCGGGCPILLKGWFWELPNQSDIPKLLQKLQEFRCLKPWELNKFNFELGDKKCAEFYVTRLPDSIGQYNRWICTNNTTGWVNNVNKALLEKTIQAKSNKLGNYHKVVDDVILLLVIDRRKGSGKLEWCSQEICHGCGFTSVYLHIFPFETHKIA